MIHHILGMISACVYIYIHIARQMYVSVCVETCVLKHDIQASRGWLEIFLLDEVFNREPPI